MDHPDEYSSDEWELMYDVRYPGHYCDSPSCYICGYGFSASISYLDDAKLYALRDKRRLVPAEELESRKVFQRKAWWNLFRTILCNQKTRTYRISGVAVYRGGGTAVPLNERDGYLGGWLTPSQDRLVMEPKFRHPLREPRKHWEWVGYHVHARCWELLSYHELGAIAADDLAVFLEVLRERRRGIYETQPRGLPDCREDPVRTRCISEAIGMALEQADRRKLKDQRRDTDRKPVRRVVLQIPQTRISLLPNEILYTVFEYLPSEGVSNVEKALGIRLSELFWRLRIPTKLLYEIDDIIDEEIDWKRLCLKLERRLESSGALAMREYLFSCLDDILRFVKRSNEIQNGNS